MVALHAGTQAGLRATGTPNRHALLQIPPLAVCFRLGWVCSTHGKKNFTLSWDIFTGLPR